MPGSTEGAHRLLSPLSVQFHFKVPAALQKLLAVTKTRKGKCKMMAWEPLRRERILLALVSVDEASPFSETKEMPRHLSGENLAADSSSRHPPKPHTPDPQLYCPSAVTDPSVGCASTLRAWQRARKQSIREQNRPEGTRG